MRNASKNWTKSFCEREKKHNNTNYTTFTLIFMGAFNFVENESVRISYTFNYFARKIRQGFIYEMMHTNQLYLSQQKSFWKKKYIENWKQSKIIMKNRNEIPQTFLIYLCNFCFVFRFHLIEGKMGQTLDMSTQFFFQICESKKISTGSIFGHINQTLIANLQ